MLDSYPNAAYSSYSLLYAVSKLCQVDPSYHVYICIAELKDTVIHFSTKKSLPKVHLKYF